MSEKMLNTRIQQKHDIEVNWSKAVNFIPKIGEIIVYDPDENHAAARVKIGDGVKTVVELAFIDDAAKAALFKEIDMVDEKVEALGQLVGDASIPEQIEEALLKTQADWEVNDETSAAYVKNRTHYTEVVSVLPETTAVIFSNQSELLRITIPFNENLITGVEYVVNLNGKNYTCKAFTIDNVSDSVCLGNTSLLGIGDDTGEPFLLYQEGGWIGDNYCYGAIHGINEEVNVSIDKIIIHKLPNEYLNIFSSETAKYILPETAAQIMGDDWAIIAPLSEKIIAGDKYTVVWNGVEYTCKATSFAIDGEILTALGNIGVMGMPGVAATGEPFILIIMPPEIVAQVGASVAVLPLEEVDSITVGIKSGKKIDLKYLPERTHWKEEGPIDILSEITLENEEGGSFPILTPFASEIVVGETYTVTYNDEEYKCTAFETPINEEETIMAPVVGNRVLLDGEDTGEPFIIAYIPPKMVETFGGYGVVVDIAGETSATVKIQHEDAIYHKLDYRYLPIPMNDDVVEILPEMVLDHMGGGEFGTTTPILEPVIDGETYTIVWNGIPYECVASEIDIFEEGIMFPVVGDLAIFKTGEPTGIYPFAIAFVPNEYVDMLGATVAVVSIEEVSEVTLAVKKSSGQLKIDPVCLPPYNWNANEDEAGHILNRTHYSIDFDPIIYKPKDPSFDIIVEPERVEGSTGIVFHTKFIKISDRVYPSQLLRSIPHYVVSTDNIKYKIITEDSNIIGCDEQKNFYSYGGISTLEAIVPYQILVAFKAGTYTDGGYIYKMPSPGIYISINSNIQDFTFEISVEGNEIVHKLDQKFLPNYNWEASEDEDGHILNRTHYEEQSKVIIPEKTFNVYDDGFIHTPFTLIEGKEYIITVNGTEYTCAAQKFEREGYTFMVLGKFDGIDQDKPYQVTQIPSDLVSQFGYYGLITTIQDPNNPDVTMSVRTKYTLKKLDPKFLPEISSVEVDTTLSVEGMAADAKAVGDAIAANKISLESVSDEEIIAALIESNLMLAVADADNSILTDENGNIIEW